MQKYISQSFKLTEELINNIEVEAERRMCNKSVIVRQVLAEYFRK